MRLEGKPRGLYWARSTEPGAGGRGMPLRASICSSHEPRPRTGTKANAGSVRLLFCQLAKDRTSARASLWRPSRQFSKSQLERQKKTGPRVHGAPGPGFRSAFKRRVCKKSELTKKARAPVRRFKGAWLSHQKNRICCGSVGSHHPGVTAFPKRLPCVRPTMAMPEDALISESVGRGPCSWQLTTGSPLKVMQPGRPRRQRAATRSRAADTIEAISRSRDPFFLAREGREVMQIALQKKKTYGQVKSRQKLDESGESRLLCHA